MIRTGYLLLTTLLLLAGCGASDNSGSEADQQAQVWLPVGGAATVEWQASLGFLQFIPGLPLEELAQVSRGRELFVADWEMAPGARPQLDGLGPLFVAGACDLCHTANGRAASLLADGQVGSGLLFRLGDASGQPDPHLGGQLQPFATVGRGEGDVSWQDDGSGKPQFVLSNPTHALAAGIHLGPRLSPQLTGVGLLNLVPEEQILAYEDESDSNADGISGRAHRLQREGQDCIGRFGWKAMQCSLRGQSAGALQQDMGLTSVVNPQEPCTEHQDICASQPSGGNPEVSAEALGQINEFLSVLAVYERRVSDNAAFERGAQLFAQTGCAACHRPTLTTRTDAALEPLRGQTIYAYTDLLLHDMGADLSDGVGEGNAQPQEWRTPPLWGLGLLENDGVSRFLHDGRAQTLPQAILWHGGEGLAAKQAFEQLSQQQRDDLLSFLRAI